MRMKRIGPLVFLLCLGGCPNSVRDVFSDALLAELSKLTFPASGNVTVLVINESCDDAFVRVTMQVTGRLAPAQVHLSERTIPSGATETFIGPDSAEFVIVESGRPGDAADALHTRTLVFERDFVADEIIEIRIPPRATLILQQPADQTVCEGAPATFAVEADGTGPLSYQWRLDGIVIPGAVEPTLLIETVTVEDAGVYDVVVSNPCVEVISDPARLAVDTAPTIVQHPVDQAVCEGAPATFTFEADGTAPLSFQWRKGGIDIPSATDDTLTIDPVSIDDAASYDVIIQNLCGSETSAAARLTIDTAPTIAEHPVDQTVCEGALATFTVEADGTPPLSFQLRKDGLIIAEGTGVSLTIGPVTIADAGSYEVLVSNACGLAQSRAAVLTVQTDLMIMQQPGDQTVCEGAPATFTVEADGTPPLSFQWRLDGIDIPGAVEPTLLIEAVTVEDAGVYDVAVSNPCGVVISNPARLTVDTAAVIVQQPMDETVCDGEPVTFSVVADASPSPSYQWRKDGEDLPGATDPTLTIDPVTVEDAGLYDVVIQNLCGSETSAAARLTVDTAPEIVQQPMDATVCAGDAVTFRVVADALPPPSYQWRLDGQDILGATDDTLTIDPVTVEDAGLYDVVIQNLCGSETSAAARLTVDTAPVIVQQPMDATVCDDDPVTFSVVADASPPPSYQWRKDGQDIPDATDPTLTIDPVTFGDAGVYDVVITNLCGVVISDPALLTVLDCTLLLGDLNCDGQLNGGDIDPFFLALGDPGAYLKAFPNCNPLNGDINCDGALNGGDVDFFFACLGAGGCTCP